MEPFEAERPRLVGIAYRMCRTFDDAEDVVQEAWLRWQAAAPDSIESPPAWLTTVVTRLAIDRLRVLERERSRYVGPWLPEPVVDAATADRLAALAGPSSEDPQWRAELADSLTTTFLLILEELSPTERAALLLVEVFGESQKRAAEILDRSPEATRQMVSRARRKLREVPDVARPGDSEERKVAEQFVLAAVTGDFKSLRSLMAEDVVALSDGGAETHAARRPVVGIERVSRYVVNLTKREVAKAIEPVLVAGHPGVLVREGDEPEMVTWFEVVRGQVRRIHSIRNPDKLRHIESHPDLV
ncbi:MAG: RNA polymerase sigma factor SigJ [Microthrixaceae bacterium]